MKKISVIIPVFNEERTICRLLDFLLAEDVNNELEIIIVDAGSEDCTGKCCSNYPVQFVSSEKGRAKQMNHGAKVSTGEILYFVHADTIPPKGFIEDLKLAVSVGKSIGCYRFKFESKKFLLRFNSFFTRFDAVWLRGGDQTLFVTRTLFDQLNGYDEYYTIMEEYDFIRRALVVTKFHKLPKSVLVSARKYTTNSWLRVQLVNAKAVRMFSKGVTPDEIRDFYKSSLNPF